MTILEKLPRELEKILKNSNNEFDKLTKSQKIRFIDHTITHCWINGDRNKSVYYALQINKLLKLKHEIEKSVKN